MRRGQELATPRPAPYKALELLEAAADHRPGRAASPPRTPRSPSSSGRPVPRTRVRLRPGAEAGQAPGRRAGQELAKPVTKVGVIGAGLMAGQFALLFVRRLQGAGGHHRPRPGARRQGPRLHPRRDRQAAGQGPHLARRGEPAARRWSPARPTRTDFADGDWVIEAVFEELAVKKQVFAEVEQSSRPSASWPPTPPRCR